MPKSPSMKCYFLRHGIAVEPAAWTGRDFDRPLTREGHERMAREADAIAALSLGLDVIVTSPLLRAKQTAAIVAERLKMVGQLVEDARVADDFDVERIAEMLEDYAKADAIMFVGHEPSMSCAIGRLIGEARVDVKKGALACVDVVRPATAGGTLLWLLPPKVLASFAKR